MGGVSTRLPRIQKDALGRYRLPLVHQRPIFLLGAPGLGKTAIMQQVADEMGVIINLPKPS